MVYDKNSIKVGDEVQLYDKAGLIERDWANRPERWGGSVHKVTKLSDPWFNAGRDEGVTVIIPYEYIEKVVSGGVRAFNSWVKESKSD